MYAGRRRPGANITGLVTRRKNFCRGADAVNAKFYRCSLRAGCSVTPELDREKITILIFNGKTGYITTPYDLYNVTEPSFFIPDFDRVPYTVHAVEDSEFIRAVFSMNQWDREFYEKWNLHLPFFSKYSDGVQYDQDCKGPNTRSYSILQPFQLGHVSIGVVKAIGEGTDERRTRPSSSVELLPGQFGL